VDEINTEHVVIGTRVGLKDVGTGKEKNYIILGPWDADIDRGIISYLAPVGRGLLGKKAGATVEIELPDGKISYEILSIEVAPDELMVRED